MKNVYEANKNVVTVLTPVYNREKEISKLYESLCSQTNKNFNWIIVDDGSTDDLRNVVNDFINNSNLSIRYIYKENGGKHTALNVGIAEIRTPLTFIVDSDDWLIDDSIETIIKYHEKYKANEEICGYSFLRIFSDGNVSGKEYSKKEIVANHIDMRINSSDLMADKAEVFYTKCLKEFPFPEFEGEKFLGEDVVWIRMAKKYKMVYINKPIYCFEYLNSGLTRNRRVHNIYSPNGCVCRAKEFMCKEIRFKYRLRGAVQYVVYGKFAGYSFNKSIRGGNTNFKMLVLLCYLPGTIIYHCWKHKYLEN